MIGYLPIIAIASTALVLAYLILSAGAHSNRLTRHEEALDRHDQDIDNVHQRIDHIAGYPYPEPAPTRDPHPAATEPIKGRHHE